MGRAKKKSPPTTTISKVEKPGLVSAKPVRRCHVCGAAWDGPSLLWDAHWRDGIGMLDTCSASCRQRGGFKDRRLA